MSETTALQRLGNVFYWMGLGVAGLLVIGGTAFMIAISLQGRTTNAEILVAVISFLLLALTSYLIGRAAKYVLGGR